MKYFILLFLVFCFYWCSSQVTLSTEMNKDIVINSMEEITEADKDWLKALNIIFPESYEKYCSFYVGECPTTIESFSSYIDQVSKVDVHPVYKSRWQMDGLEYLLFSMDFVLSNGKIQLVPLLVIENNGSFKLMPRKSEQQLFEIKALFSYLDPEKFMRHAKEDFGGSQKIKEIDLYNKLVEEASKREVNPNSLFRLPKITANKKLPLKYEGIVEDTYSSKEYQKALVLHQRGFESAAFNLLSSKIPLEELEKLIKDEVRN